MGNPSAGLMRGKKKTYHAVREAVHHLIEEASHKGLVGREVVVRTAREQDGDGQETVLDARERCRSLPPLRVKVDGEEPAQAALELDVGLRDGAVARGPGLGHGHDEALQSGEGLGTMTSWHDGVA